MDRTPDFAILLTKRPFPLESALNVPFMNPLALLASSLLNFPLTALAVQWYIA